MLVKFSKQLKSINSLISLSQLEHFLEQRAQQKIITNLQAGFAAEQANHETAENEREYIVHKAVKEAKAHERQHFK